MNRTVVLGLGMLVCVGWTSVGQAQHLDRHGNHFDLHQNVPHGHDAAGHLTDRLGHHIDGHGNHTGAVGVYENGARSLSLGELFGNSYRSQYGGFGSSYYQSNPYYSYSNPYYSGSYYVNPGSYNYGNAGYYGGTSNLYGTSRLAVPQVIVPSVAVPQVAASPARVLATPPTASIVANKLPVGSDAVVSSSIGGLGGTATVRNPADSGGSLQYNLNSYTYSIQPGEEQTLSLDRQWVIRFDNGLGQEVIYRLEDGTYEFTVSKQTGWDLVKRVAASPRQSAPSVPRNAIPN